MPNVPEAAVLLIGDITRIYEPREGDRPGRQAFVQTADGAAVIRFTPDQEQTLSRPLSEGQRVSFLIRYRVWVSDDGKPYLTKRFVREVTGPEEAYATPTVPARRERDLQPSA